MSAGPGRAACRAARQAARRAARRACERSITVDNLRELDHQQSTDLDQENDSFTANMPDNNIPLTYSEPGVGTPLTIGNLDDNKSRNAEKSDQAKKVLQKWTLGEKFKEHLKFIDSNKQQSSDDELTVDDVKSSKTPKKKAKNLKRALDDNEKSSTRKKRKVAKDNKELEVCQTVVAAGAGQVNANKTTVNGPDSLASQNSPLEIGTNSEEENLHPANKKKNKADRKKKDEDSKYDVILKVLNKISDDVDWLKGHHTGLESFVVDNLTANSENWNQVKHVKPPSSKENLKIEDINRPPDVGYVRLDTNAIHLGHNVWLPKQAYDDDVYNATTNSMFVKNIAIALFGAKYLKEHSVKGKSCNKTKSVPRPAIDPTKALAVRDIFEYYLKTNKQLKGEKLLVERDCYEDHIRAKISDLLRLPKKPKPKAPSVSSESDSSSSSDSGSSSDSEDQKDSQQKEDTHKEEDTIEKTNGEKKENTVKEKGDEKEEDDEKEDGQQKGRTCRRKANRNIACF